jgi:cysteinyl-tRNA synthetase
MQLYNTLTRSVDPISPLNPPKVTVYTCGPTVYDYAHIGHWFNYVRMDTLIRTLKLSGLQPEWVMNITDVGHLVSDADEGEDKLEKGAKREGKTAWEVAEFYTQDFLECMQLLHITDPDHITKATDHIQEQIDLIRRLEEKGYTYIISDGVYYDTSKFEGYAAFARLDLEGMQAGARVDYNKEKRNPTDFALWKFSPKDAQRDMEWDSPWSPPGEQGRKGFPGWHIECSAMSMKYLGDELDIHTGGIDHVPVHHTNEIAQSEAATGKRFAQHWMHSNHVMVNGDKISKSLGNGIRLQEILEKGISAEAVRLHILESHYRSQSQFSLESLEAASNRLKSYTAMAARRYQPILEDGGLSPAALTTYMQQIQKALMNDLNTAQALAELSGLADAIDNSGISISSQEVYGGLLDWLDEAFGLQLATIPDISDEQKQTISDRQQARGAKEWGRSDELRDKLAAQGVGVRDTATGPIWYWL